MSVSMGSLFSGRIIEFEAAIVADLSIAGPIVGLFLCGVIGYPFTGSWWAQCAIKRVAATTYRPVQADAGRERDASIRQTGLPTVLPAPRENTPFRGPPAPGQFSFGNRQPND